jgi:hypothetical protein
MRTSGERRGVAGVLVGGLIAGTLDIAYAMISAQLRGRSPVRTVQAVASGVLGAPAFDGGWATFWLGMLLHFAIALGAATTFWLISRRLRFALARPVLAGLLFGVGVYLFMNFVVLPLSVVPFTLRYPPRVLLAGFVSHGLLVGLPIALCVRRWSGAPPAVASRTAAAAV